MLKSSGVFSVKEVSQGVMSRNRTREPVVLRSYQKHGSLETYIHEWQSIRESRVINYEELEEQGQGSYQSGSASSVCVCVDMMNPLSITGTSICSVNGISCVLPSISNREGASYTH